VLADNRVTRTVVIGGSGFIGSRVALGSADDGSEVTVVDVVSPQQDVAASCRVELRDTSTPGSLADVLDDAAVIVIAAAKLAKLCAQDPRAAWAANVDGTRNVLDAAGGSGRRPRIVFLSTGNVYRSPGSHPLTEHAATTDDGLYARSKLLGEQAVAGAAARHGLSAIVLRLFTVYGPGPASGARGHFVAGWMERASNGHPIVVHGTGDQTVDLTHVSDVARACRLAAESPLPDGACRTYNIGGGRETRVRELADWFRAVVPDLEVEHAPFPDSMPRRQFADYTRAGLELGYAPLVDPRAGIDSLLRSRPELAGAGAVGAV
jgi:nucleoside-diphosphate-sugar epimerase